jgi:molybdenum cofactor cytidylyltransferase
VGTRVVGVLLAAGRGHRFRDSGGGDKLLAQIDGRPVACRACDALVAACDAVVAVLRPDTPDALADRLRSAGATLVVAQDADLGMGHSLAAGARAATPERPGAAAQALLVLPADLAWIRADSVRAVADAARADGPGEVAARIVVPVLRDGRQGHPVAFGGAHAGALARLRGDRGARALLDAHPVVRIVVDDPGILRDVDTLPDLEPRDTPR